MSARKLSNVSGEDMAAAHSTLESLFEHYAEGPDGVTKESLVKFAKEGGLLDK